MQNQPNHPSEKIETQWNILNILRWTTGYFQSPNIENPRASAEILLAHALDLSRIDLYIRYDQPLSKDELAIFKALIKRRVRQEPVAYIVGCKDFWSLELVVTKDVLIPRPETECLVEAVLGLLPSSVDSNVETARRPVSAADVGSSSETEHRPVSAADVGSSSETEHRPVSAADVGSSSETARRPVSPKRVLDLGTGSGAIILSLASERPGHIFFASDRSEKAIQVAKKNARAHHLDQSVCFFNGNWFEPFETDVHLFDFILSNPPYIRTGDIKTLQPEINQYEPLLALDGGEDGLSDIREIIVSAHRYLVKGGYLLLEIGYDQKEDVYQIADTCGEYEDVIFTKDYSGHDRVVRMRRK